MLENFCLFQEELKAVLFPGSLHNHNTSRSVHWSQVERSQYCRRKDGGTCKSMCLARSHLRVSCQSILLRPNLIEALPLHLVLLFEPLPLFPRNFPRFLFHEILKNKMQECYVRPYMPQAPRLAWQASLGLQHAEGAQCHHPMPLRLHPQYFRRRRLRQLLRSALH